MLKDLLLTVLKDAVKKIEDGQCEMSQEQMEDLVKAFAHQPMSKAQACDYLGISRSKFDQLVSDGKLPKGQKRVGFKELVYYKDELSI